MPSKSIDNLPVNVQTTLTSYAGVYGVDPTITQAVAVQESGGNQGAVSGAGAVGIMQLEPDTFYSLRPPSPPGVFQSTGKPYFTDINDPNQNMEAGTYYLSQQYDEFGNYPTALAAYNAGPGAVNRYGGIPPYNETQNYVNSVSKIAQNGGSQNSQIAQPNLQKSLNGQSTMKSPSQVSVPSTTAQPISGTQVTPDLVAQLNPQLQIDTGLTETAWYDDTGLVTGNPRVRQSVQPVSFTVYLDQTRGPLSQLVNPVTGSPVTLQLNCSLRTFELQSRHVFNRTPSRTGMHVTFWGMHPDLIVGTGSTGIFMNQIGLTDWFSVANVSDAMKQQVINGMVSVAMPYLQQAGTGTVTPDSIFSSIVSTEAPDDPSEAFRVAAQDAFIEFMKLFQMNGIVWFHSPNYQGFQTGMDQQGPNAWSPSTGATSFQQTGRNNDVMTRGYVAMSFRNSIYLGYFKSLSWVLDAEKPFSWEFNFTFQVERTVSALYYPDVRSTSLPSNATGGSNPVGGGR